MKIMIVVYFLFILGCTSQNKKLTEYPILDLTESSIDVSLVHAKPVSGRNLNHIGRCKDVETVCMNEPPAAITYRTKKHIYGHKLPEKFEVGTKEYEGLKTFNFSAPSSELILVFTQGKKQIIPAEFRKLMVQDKNQQYVLPLFFDRDILWLPCDILKLVKPIEFDPSYNDIIGIPLKTSKQAYRKLIEVKHAKVEGNWLLPTRAIYLEDIEHFFSNKNLNYSNFLCDG